MTLAVTSFLVYLFIYFTFVSFYLIPPIFLERLIIPEAEKFKGKGTRIITLIWLGLESVFLSVRSLASCYYPHTKTIFYLFIDLFIYLFSHFYSTIKHLQVISQGS